MGVGHRELSVDAASDLWRGRKILIRNLRQRIYALEGV
jgi:hypothetical protein